MAAISLLQPSMRTERLERTHPRTMKGLLRPKRDLQRSERTPTRGCTMSPESGPARKTTDIMLLLTPSDSKNGDAMRGGAGWVSRVLREPGSGARLGSESAVHTSGHLASPYELQSGVAHGEGEVARPLRQVRARSEHSGAAHPATVRAAGRGTAAQSQSACASHPCRIANSPRALSEAAALRCPDRTDESRPPDADVSCFRPQGRLRG